MEIKEKIALLFILICAVYDCKTKEIPVWIITLFGTIAIIIMAASGNKEDVMPVIYAFVPGAFLLLLSLCTKESVGYGDGFVVLVIGLLVGFAPCVSAVCAAFVLSGIFSFFLLILHRINVKSRLAYMPFLAAGLGVVIFGKYIL